jgi:fermentation-respiration switch protein FrsA (DUF1100 family)
LQEAVDNYLTSHARRANAQNKMLFNAFGAWVGGDTFDVVDTLLTQPLLVIAGDEAGSLWHTKELYARAPGPKEFVPHQGCDSQGVVPWQWSDSGRRQDGSVLQE